MRRMFSENQIKEMIEESPSNVVKALKGQDVEINGLTSKGIANTGGFANIGNVAISGDLTANSIIENMSGYSFTNGDSSKVTYNYKYVGVVKNGNKITFVIYLDFMLNSDFTGTGINLGTFGIPYSIGERLFPVTIAGTPFLNYQSADVVKLSNGDVVRKQWYTQKASSISLRVGIAGLNDLSLETHYLVRTEATFLLSEDIVPKE